MPLPPWLALGNPPWSLMVLIHFALVAPERVGVATAFALGLLQDAAQGTLLGQHALAATVVVYFVLKARQLLRFSPWWQQIPAVLGLLAGHQLLVFWLDGLTGHPPWDAWYLMPAAVGALVWPWLSMALKGTDSRPPLA